MSPPKDPEIKQSVKKRPVLIVDKEGSIGALLVRSLNMALPVVFVSQKVMKTRGNSIHIPFVSKIPHIPNNRYAYLFVVPEDVNSGQRLFSTLRKKAQTDDAKLVMLYSLRAISAKDKKNIAKQGQSSTVFIIGDMYGEELKKEQSWLQGILYQAKKRKIVLPNEGRTQYYPVLSSEIAPSMFSFLESNQKTSGVFFLFEKRGISSLSIARKLMKRDPEIQIDFMQEAEEGNIALPLGESILLNDGLEKKLAVVSDTLLTSETGPLKKRKSRKKNGVIKKYIGLFVLLFILLPYVLFFLSLGSAWLLLATVQRDVRRLAFFPAAEKAHVAGALFSFAARAGNYNSVLLELVGQHVLAQKIIVFAKDGQTFSAIAIDATDGLKGMSLVFSGKTKNPKSAFVTAASELKRAFIGIEDAQTNNLVPKMISQELGKYNTEIQLLASTSDTLPLLLGFEGKRKYLVLFQNNMELRPGGGFIGSYGIVSVVNGKVSPPVVHDVYDADGQLRGHVDPPLPLKRYEGVTHWFLRDSNFSPNFPTNSASASRFLGLETGEQVDGVIAIDVTFLRELLGAYGNLYLPAYNLTVTPENFYSLTEKESQDKFFPGSTQKKDFLSALVAALQLRFTSGKPLPYAKLVQAIRTSLYGKHILLGVNEQAIEDQLQAADFAGALKDLPISTQASSITDTFGISEANLGTNKVNNYIRRSIKQHVLIGQAGDMHEQVTIQYENDSSGSTIFGGPYKNYVRVITPLNSTLDAIAIDGKEVDIADAITDPAVFTQPNFVPPAALEVLKTVEEKKTLFGFFVTIPQKTERSIDISYTLPLSSSVHGSTFDYALTVLKQPGTGNDPYTLTISYPSNYTASVQDPLQMNDQGVTYVTQLATDLGLKASFSRSVLKK